MKDSQYWFPVNQPPASYIALTNDNFKNLINQLIFTDILKERLTIIEKQLPDNLGTVSVSAGVNASCILFDMDAGIAKFGADINVYINSPFGTIDYHLAYLEIRLDFYLDTRDDGIVIELTGIDLAITGLDEEINSFISTLLYQKLTENGRYLHIPNYLRAGF